MRVIAFTVSFAIASVMAARTVVAQDRVEQERAGQQTWRFDVSQPDWKLLPERDPTYNPGLTSRTADALRVTIPDGKRQESGSLAAGIYADVPTVSLPFRVVVQARASASIGMMFVGVNLFPADIFRDWSDGVAAVPDGAVHTYEWFVWHDAPAKQFGLWIRASEPGSLDILSIKYIPQATNRWSYRGFTVDIAPLDASPDRDALLQALRHQFDVVTDVGLDQRTLDFFRSVPIVINPVAMADPATPGSRFGRYINGTVVIVPRVYGPREPIFLHEFMHAYHSQKLGFRNPDVVRLFEEARSNRKFPENSYLMSNVAEYFAVAGSTFLYGSAGGIDPSTRDSLKNGQPGLYQFLVGQFGPR